MRVIATALGWDGKVLRQPGEEFDMPDDVFEKRPRKGADGKPTGEFYPPPSWFTAAKKGKGQKPDAPGEDSGLV